MSRKYCVPGCSSNYDNTKKYINVFNVQLDLTAYKFMDKVRGLNFTLS